MKGRAGRQAGRQRRLTAAGVWRGGEGGTRHRAGCACTNPRRAVQQTCTDSPASPSGGSQGAERQAARRGAARGPHPVVLPAHHQRVSHVVRVHSKQPDDRLEHVPAGSVRAQEGLGGRVLGVQGGRARRWHERWPGGGAGEHRLPAGTMATQRTTLPSPHLRATEGRGDGRRPPRRPPGLPFPPTPCRQRRPPPHLMELPKMKVKARTTEEKESQA